MVLYGFYIYRVGLFLCKPYIFITRVQIMVINKTSFICILPPCWPKYLQLDYKIKGSSKITNSTRDPSQLLYFIAVLVFGLVLKSGGKNQPGKSISFFKSKKRKSVKSFKAQFVLRD